ncbi:hypothetical protein lerEdw1_003381 [Lerista edwardsae]|nr:hypothetical protein lerEdw1_003381 [Lerista edwardsae]
MKAGDVSSISGSDSSDTDSDNESDPPSYQVGEDKGNNHKGSSLLSPRSQRVLFRNSEGQLLSVYRCVLNPTKACHGPPKHQLASSFS